MPLGEGRETEVVAAEILTLTEPNITRWLPLVPYRNPQDVEHMLEALREAGIS